MHGIPRCMRGRAGLAACLAAAPRFFEHPDTGSGSSSTVIHYRRMHVLMPPQSKPLHSLVCPTAARCCHRSTPPPADPPSPSRFSGMRIREENCNMFCSLSSPSSAGDAGGATLMGPDDNGRRGRTTGRTSSDRHLTSESSSQRPAAGARGRRAVCPEHNPANVTTRHCDRNPRHVHVGGHELFTRFVTSRPKARQLSTVPSRRACFHKSRLIV
jgi:hypothetical protein